LGTCDGGGKETAEKALCVPMVFHKNDFVSWNTEYYASTAVLVFLTAKDSTSSCPPEEHQISRHEPRLRRFSEREFIVTVDHDQSFRRSHGTPFS